MSSSAFSRVVCAIAIAAILPVSSLPVIAQEEAPPSSRSEQAEAPPATDIPAEDSGSPGLVSEQEASTEKDQADETVAAPANDDAQMPETAAASEDVVPPDVGTKATSDANLVSTGGEYVYTFPFDLPKYHDLVPDLRLHYNSSRKNRGGSDNIVAFGWRLGGLSRIERVSLGGGVPTYDDGQDFYRLDGADLMGCNDAAATNKWARKYPLRFLTDKPSASCSAGGNLAARVESGMRIRYDQASNEFFDAKPNGGDIAISRSAPWQAIPAPLGRSTRWPIRTAGC